MNFEHVQSVAAIFDAAPTLTEIDVRGTGVALRLRRAAPTAPPAASRATAPVRAKTPQSAAVAALPVPVPASAPMEAENDLREPAAAEGNTLVTAEMVGVFRAARAGKKGTEPIPAAPGDSVAEGQSLGSVETMRILNDCAAPVSGVLQSVFVLDGQPVEYGQALFEIAPGVPDGGDTDAALTD